MKDRTNRRLLIIFGLCILLSIGAIAIGFFGIVDLLDSGIFTSLREWIEPIVSIRSDRPSSDSDPLSQTGPSAMDLEATRLAEEGAKIAELFADWSLVFEEPFDTNEAGWPEFEEDDSLAKLKVELVNGKYRWEATANDGFAWWSYPDMDPLSDFYVEVEAIQLEGDPYGEMGIVFHLDEDRFYLYEVSGEFFALWRSVPDGWESLIDWTESLALRPNQVNLLGILMIDDRIHLFINDRLVGEFTDLNYTAGVIGLAIGLEESRDEGTFEFDNLQVSAP